MSTIMFFVQLLNAKLGLFFGITDASDFEFTKNTLKFTN